MAATYELIASNTLSTSAASVTFSGIPSTYTDLVLKINTRVSSGIASSLIYKINSDTNTNYSRVLLRGDGKNRLSNLTSNSSNPQLTTMNQGISTTSNTFTNVEIYIPSYTVSQNKPISVFGTTENNANTSYIAVFAALWRNTSAITSIELTDGSGFTFETYSSFYLYGIKNS